MPRAATEAGIPAGMPAFIFASTCALLQPRKNRLDADISFLYTCREYFIKEERYIMNADPCPESDRCKAYKATTDSTKLSFSRPQATTILTYSFLHC